ncbi:MAG: hypothetical protein Salg2KO_16310 [Salibacteraceae bacterium]
MRWKIAQWFEKIWWKRYLRNQDKSSYLGWKVAYWESFLKELGIKPSGKVLDAGCGPAGIFIALHECEVQATDPLLEYYSKALDHFEKSDYPNVRFQSTTIEEIGGSEQYDYLFCVNAINHVRDIGKALKGLSIACKQGGVMVLTTDCHKHRFWRWLLGAIPFDILHPHQYTKEEYVEMLHPFGWKIQEVRLLKQGFIFNYHAFICTKA